MTRVRLLFLCHLAALGFGLGGLLIALPHPELWAGSRNAADVFDFGMHYAGSLHIILGALTMLVFGVVALGWRRTLIFFTASASLSLAAELIGTGTGWPFGNYAYTSFLGHKVLGHVPFTIPLSWFYVGFATYLLANTLAGRYAPRARGLAAVLGGAALLTVWDLVLDPAMAHDDMIVKFWTWSKSGPYFGMPLQNFAGWALNAALFMAIARLLWRHDPEPREYPVWVPFGVYVANTLFAMALALSVGLWQPIVLAAVLGVIPATLALRLGSGARVTRPTRQRRVTPAGPGQAIVAAGARAVAARQFELRVEGREHLPRQGPALLAARHYHHLHDGCALLSAAGRPVRILVALDWVRSARLRPLLERACRSAGWPVALRPDGLAAQPGGAYRADEARVYLTRAVRDAVALLRAGEALVVFPEAYPTIDPSYSPKQGDERGLPALPPRFHPPGRIGPT